MRNGLIKVHKYINEIPNEDYDNTHKDGRNYIDIVVMSYGCLISLFSICLSTFARNSSYL